MAQKKRVGRIVSGGQNANLESAIEDLGNEINAFRRNIESRVLQLEQTVAEMQAEVREVHEQLAEQEEN